MNHVEYKQGFKNDLKRKFQASHKFVEIRKMVSVDPAEYFNLRIAKYGWRIVEAGCFENHSSIYTQLMKRQS